MTCHFNIIMPFCKIWSIGRPRQAGINRQQNRNSTNRTAQLYGLNANWHPKLSKSLPLKKKTLSLWKKAHAFLLTSRKLTEACAGCQKAKGAMPLAACKASFLPSFPPFLADYVHLFLPCPAFVRKIRMKPQKSVQLHSLCFTTTRHWVALKDIDRRNI